ncbi:MAG: hypothetical protein HY277_09400 [Ignavibacteriales bacterium]|nr:hypothetical protein [Ignavibacteriales bacterium]
MRQPYARSVTGGSSFEVTREMLPDSVHLPYGSNRPAIVAERDDVYLFFVSADSPSNINLSPVRMLKSIDRGITFGSVKNISPDITGEITWATMSGDTIALIYPPEPDLYRRILRSSNGGLTWSKTTENINPNPNTSDLEDRISLSPSSLHMVQNKVINDIGEVVYRRSTNIGDSWAFDTLVSAADGYFSDIPTIASYQSKCSTELLVAWRDDKYGCVYCFLGASIISRAGLANGKMWLPENVLTEKLPTGSEPRAAIHGNNRAVAWTEEINPPDTFRVAIRATNNSITNYCPKTILSLRNTPGNEVAISSHAIHIVYEEKVGSTFRIFYRRGELIPSNASFSLSTGLVQMDTTEINETSTDTVTVSNTGTDPLIVGTAISDNENFSVMPPSDTISPASSHPFAVRYTPKTFGTHAGKIIFYHNGQSSPDCFAVTGVSKWNSETISYQQGKWNMVSIPVKPGPVQKLPQMFSFDGAMYQKRDTMKFGVGYFAKPVDSVKEFQGIKVFEDSFSVKQGWNMIGTVSQPVARTNITAVPDTIIASSFFTFSGSSYIVADTLLPGMSYWVKVKALGKLILR